jgi:hypothetical protein
LLATLERILEGETPEIQPTLVRASNLVAEVLNADKVDVFLSNDAQVDTLVAGGTSQTPMGQRQKELGLDRLAVSNGGRIVEVFQTGGPT